MECTLHGEHLPPGVQHPPLLHGGHTRQAPPGRLPPTRGGVESSTVICCNKVMPASLKSSELKVAITRVDLAELICGQKLKSKRIAYKFLIFNSFVKPSVKTSAVKRDLYLALDKIKIK